MTKYGNKITYRNGIKFDSKLEADFHAEYLRPLEMGKKIKDLQIQQKFKYLSDDGSKTIFTYKADFSYRDTQKNENMIVDTKSTPTAKNSTFKLKKKLIEDRYKIKITVVTREKNKWIFN